MTWCLIEPSSGNRQAQKYVRNPPEIYQISRVLPRMTRRLKFAVARPIWRESKGFQSDEIRMTAPDNIILLSHSGLC